MRTSAIGALAAGAGSARAATARVGTARAGTARAGTASGSGPVPARELSKFTEALPIPPAIDMRAGGALALAAGSGEHVFHRALGRTPAFGYGGAGYLGPTLVVRQGKPIAVTFSNRLGPHPLASVIDLAIPGARASDRTAPRISVHMHGGKTPPEYDGHPMDWFTVGSSHFYRYLNDQEACLSWYHDHAMGITRLNAYAGLAAGYLIRDDWDTGEPGNGPGLPYGAYEIPLIVQDKMFARRGRDSALFYPRRDPAVAATLPPGSPRIWIPEFFGNVAVVNGKAWPSLDVARSVYRFRMVNGSQARFYRLFFAAGGPPLWQIGTDQGLLNAPVPLTDGLLIAPGERVDLLIDFSQATPGQEWVLRNDAPTPYPGGDETMPKIGEIMRFTVTSGSGPFRRIPARLRRGPIRPLSVDGVIRNVTLQERLTGDGESYGPLLNGLPFMTSDRNIISSPRGYVEQWNIINLTSDAHPMHLHLTRFQIQERVPFRGPAGEDGIPRGVTEYNAAWHVDPDSEVPILGWGIGADHTAQPFLDQGRARPPAPNERGWKDTAICPPGQVTRLAVPFTGIGFDPDVPYRTQSGELVQGYVWHCHILEHEEWDMMQSYRVY